MEPEGSLPHSQASATCPYPGPAQSSPHTHIPHPGGEFYLIKYTNRVTAVGFEPTILVSERPQTYALDLAATGFGR